jgi:hypothetical protein
MEDGNWLANGVKEIERVTTKAITVEPKLINLPLEKPGTYAVLMPGEPGGEIADRLQTRLAGPSWHDEQLQSPSVLVDFIEKFEIKEGVVYVAEDQVRLHYSSADRRDRATVVMTATEPWRWLAASHQPMTQRELIRLLRITFDGCLPTGPGLIGLIRNLKFNNAGQVEANIQHGNESIGKNILNAVNGTAALPEEFSLQVRIFENFPLVQNVRCALEVIPEVARFEVIPFPQELAAAMQNTLDAIQGLFDESPVPAFMGSAFAEE